MAQNKTKEAPDKAYSHLLELADGRRFRYDVAESGGEIPTEIDGVAVSRVHHAAHVAAPEKENGNNE